MNIFIDYTIITQLMYMYYATVPGKKALKFWTRLKSMLKVVCHTGRIYQLN